MNKIPALVVVSIILIIGLASVLYVVLSQCVNKLHEKNFEGL